ncbi:MAG: hypothetical protein D4R56_02760 [Deltaproteobacteria bacterium]|nr:MAG: hypothetical protein D4R56_02760 [Deltaproteobacteria bacterium]
MEKRIFHRTIVFAFLLLITTVIGTQIAFGADNVLIATKVTTAPILDGQMDPLWGNAKTATIPVSGGTAGNLDVLAKALYTSSEVFFLFQWKDTTPSFNRQHEFDGKEWKKIKGNEDRLSIAWEMGTVAGFKDNGCMISCHGDKKRVGAGEKLDLWHWKGSRSGPVGQMDDQFVNHEKRQGDSKESGGESDNWDESKKSPKYTWKGTPIDRRFLLQSEAQQIMDYTLFKAGDRLPREVLAPFTGSRGDVSARGVWANGMWTLDVKRVLNTKHPDDVQFINLSREYPFALAVHDNDGDEHHSFAETFVLKFQ